MGETRILDYSTARPSFDAIKASGAAGVMRYTTRVTGAKGITAGEAQQIRAAGLWLGLVFEDQADRALTSGYDGGKADAQLSEQQAYAAGYPAGCVIFYAVDVEGATWDQVADYFHGVRDGSSRYAWGPYGSYDVVSGAAARGVSWLWQTVAWSRGLVCPDAHLFQRNTSAQPVAGTDENVQRRPFPLWGAPPVVSAQGTAKPAPVRPPFTTLRRGSHGDVVAHMQRDLLRVYPGPPPVEVGPQGHYTDVTAAAVARLRHDAAMPPGDIGPGDFDSRAAHKLGWNV